MKNFRGCVACAASILSAAAAAQETQPYKDDPVDDAATRAADTADEAAEDVDRATDRAGHKVDRATERAAGEADDARDRLGDGKPGDGDRKKRALMTKGVGLQVEVGGGVQQFLGQTASDLTDAGGAWTARLVVGTRSHIAAEAAYVGSAQALDALGVSDRARLTSNGVEGLLRLNVLRGALQPYAAAGYTFRRYNISNSAVNTSSVADAANVNEIPVAAGLAYRFRPLVTDLRFTLRNAFGSPLLPNANLSTYTVDAKVGFEF